MLVAEGSCVEAVSFEGVDLVEVEVCVNVVSNLARETKEW